MGIINTKSHIVLDKEGIRRYAELLHLTYGAIFEINIRMNAYQALFYTERRFPCVDAGEGKEFIATAKQYIHPEDLNSFLSIFRRKKLKEIIKNKVHETVDFRGMDMDGQYRWMRVLLIQDETEKDTILCFMLDIDRIKKCEQLEKENRELRAQMEGSQRQNTLVKPQKRIGISFNKSAIREAAEQA